MPVDSGQVAKGLYFWLDGRRECIWEVHFPRLTELIKILEPIQITIEELLALGFQENSKSGFTKYGWNFTMTLARTQSPSQPSEYWQVSFNDKDANIQVKFVHVLQRIWFAMTGNHLQYRAASSLPGQPGYTLRDHYTLSANFRWLSRHPRHAIWEIAEDNYPITVLAGHNIGIKLVAGRDVTEEDTKAALSWLIGFVKSRI